VLGGLYLALYLSRFEPVEVIKGSVKTTRGAGLRKILVVSQFVVSTAFIIGTIVANQLSYIRTKDLGFEKDRTMVMPIWFSPVRSTTTARPTSGFVIVKSRLGSKSIRIS
jgi:putative ABC transport system permease protein